MKILMLIDSMNIGGAETHVEILATELKNLGHKVIIASSGGTIQSKLEHQGLACLTFPKITRNITRNSTLAKAAPQETRNSTLAKAALQETRNSTFAKATAQEPEHPQFCLPPRAQTQNATPSSAQNTPPPPAQTTPTCADSNQAHKINQKSPWIFRFLAARSVINKIICREMPEIVHAHTRACAFLVHKICKKHKIPLIVTAHAKFSMNFPKNLLSKWGEETIAVSEDIKNHLISNGVPKNQIRVIPNGVRLPLDENFSSKNTTKGEEKCEK